MEPLNSENTQGIKKSSSMICSKCGKEARDISVFCSRCGAPLTPVNVQPDIPDNLTYSTIQPSSDELQAEPGVESGSFEIKEKAVPETATLEPVSNEDKPAEEVHKTEKVKSAGFIPIIILSVLLCLSIAFIVFGIISYSDLNKRNISLQSEILETESEKKQAESLLSDKESEIEALNEELKETKKERDQYKTDSGKLAVSERMLKDMKNQLRNLNQPSGTMFYPNKNVIVLKKKETANAIITLNSRGTMYYSSNNNVVEGEWNKNWFNNNKSDYIYFKAGNTTGTTTFTFTNSINSDSFQILVYVVD